MKQKTETQIDEIQSNINKISKCLFGNGKAGVAEQVRDNAQNIHTLATTLKGVNDSTNALLQTLPAFIQETKDAIESIKKDVNNHTEDIKLSSNFVKRLDGQISVWKYLVGILGISNIAQILFSFIK